MMEKPFLIGGLLGKDLLICCLCNEYYKDPRILPCEDTFCRKCLQNIFDEKQTKLSVKLIAMPCPKCSKVITIPQIGISGFPLDLNIRKKKEEFMNKLIDNVGSSRENNSDATSYEDSYGRTGYDMSPTDNVDYVRRSRPSFSPGTKRSQMVDGLIRSRRERSPHVSTHTAPSAASYFPTTDPFSADDSCHKYKPFSGSRPSRLTQRRKLHEGSRYKSDPGLQTHGSISSKHKTEDMTQSPYPLHRDYNSNSTSDITGCKVINDNIENTHFCDENTPTASENSAKVLEPSEKKSVRDEPPLSNIHPVRRSRTRRHVRFSHEEKVSEPASKEQVIDKNNEIVSVTEQGSQRPTLKQMMMGSTTNSAAGLQCNTVENVKPQAEDRKVPHSDTFSAVQTSINSPLEQKNLSSSNNNPGIKIMDKANNTYKHRTRQEKMSSVRSPLFSPMSPVTPTRVRKRPTIPTSLKDKIQEPQSPDIGKKSPDTCSKTKGGSPSKKFTFSSIPSSSCSYRKSTAAISTKEDTDTVHNALPDSNQDNISKTDKLQKGTTLQSVSVMKKTDITGFEQRSNVRAISTHKDKSYLSQLKGDGNLKCNTTLSMPGDDMKDGADLPNTKYKCQSSANDSNCCTPNETSSREFESVSNTAHTNNDPLNSRSKSNLESCDNVTGDKHTTLSSEAIDYSKQEDISTSENVLNKSKTDSNNTCSTTQINAKLGLTSASHFSANNNCQNDGGTKLNLLDSDNNISNEPQGYYARYVSSITPYKSKSDQDNIKITTANSIKQKPHRNLETAVKADECMVECEEMTVHSSVIQQDISTHSENIQSGGSERKNQNTTAVSILRTSSEGQDVLHAKTNSEHKTYVVEGSEGTSDTSVIREPDTNESSHNIAPAPINGSKITLLETSHMHSGCSQGLGKITELTGDKRDQEQSWNKQGHVFREKLCDLTDIKVSQRIENYRKAKDIHDKIGVNIDTDVETAEQHISSEVKGQDHTALSAAVTHTTHDQQCTAGNSHISVNEGEDTSPFSNDKNKLITDCNYRHTHYQISTKIGILPPTIHLTQAKCYKSHLNDLENKESSDHYLDQPDETAELHHQLDQPVKTAELHHQLDQPDETAKLSHHLDQPDKTAELSHHLDQPDKTAELSQHLDQPDKTAELGHLLDQSDKTAKLSHHLDQPDKTAELSHHLDQPDKTAKLSHHLDQPDKTAELGHLLDQSDKTAELSHLLDQPDKTAKLSHHLDLPDKTAKLSHHLDQPVKTAELHHQLDQPDKTDQLPTLVDPPNPQPVKDIPQHEMSTKNEIYLSNDIWQIEKHDYDMPTSVVVLSNNTTVVSEFNTGHLQYFDENGKYMHSVDGVKPFCIATNMADHVIVADRRTKTIRVFDEFGCDIMQWDNDRFKWVSGVGCTSDGNFVIYDRDSYKIGVYNQSGDKVFEFGSYGERDTQLCMADFLTVDSKDRIVLCDSGNHCIKMFDINGKFLSKFGTRGNSDGQMEWPKGICCDAQDNIIVADNRNCRVSLYSPDGVFIQTLVKDFPNPYGVCLSKSNILGVTHYSLTGFSKLGLFQLHDHTQSAN